MIDYKGSHVLIRFLILEQKDRTREENFAVTLPVNFGLGSVWALYLHGVATREASNGSLLAASSGWAPSARRSGRADGRADGRAAACRNPATSDVEELPQI